MSNDIKNYNSFLIHKIEASDIFHREQHLFHKSKQMSARAENLIDHRRHDHPIESLLADCRKHSLRDEASQSHSTG
jgi:hypothetical protein